MRYACLIYVPPTDNAPAGMLEEYAALSSDAQKAGVMTGGEQLARPSSATTVRVRDGKRLLTDGPFAETKEVLGGFMIFDCDTLDAAVEWAAKIPNARDGSIEIRPIVERGA
ncbi:MAG: YciI family protein [Candidatus Eremiobacteraeota bacterium]|nr:YciI family protein [Candidatus Eremiobacteraeota bacterium]